MANEERCGVIVKRGSGYGVSVYDPRLKRKRWVGTYKTKAEAREAERDASRRRNVGGRVTCDEFVKLWQTEYPREAGATRRTYAYALKAFADEFSGVRLPDLDRLTARSWALCRRGVSGGVTLEPVEGRRGGNALAEGVGRCVPFEPVGGVLTGT
jgi:hypothetical protein